ncbi:MAG: methionyl-tRNA formyltransferase [Proteobacteria bacterium]|nr:methionyl-tRNA formyltransferase [Pseudomonadota bacterium]
MAKIIFMGTPIFAVPALKTLFEAGHNIALVISQPDKKKGRGQKIQETPVKQYAATIGCEVYQPESLKVDEVKEKLATYCADYMVVIAYGKILPPAILTLPQKGCINVHASLLPKWRGAAPIQFAIWKDDRETGVCTMLMDKGMDTGDLLLSAKTSIHEDERVDQLTERLSLMGGDLIKRTITEFDSIVPRAQDHDQATYTRMINKEDRLLNWNQSAREIYCQFKALSPKPGMFTLFRGKRLMIKEISLIKGEDSQTGGKAGILLSITDSGLHICCSTGVICLISCQPENKKQILARDFANGYQVKINDVFGS